MKTKARSSKFVEAVKSRQFQEARRLEGSQSFRGKHRNSEVKRDKAKKLEAESKTTLEANSENKLDQLVGC